MTCVRQLTWDVYAWQDSNPSPESTNLSTAYEQPTPLGGAKSGALSTDFAELAAAWPILPEPIKAAVMALVRSVGMTPAQRQGP